MINIIQTQPKFKVYRNNKLDLALTYKPIIKQKAQKAAETIDRWFIEHKW